MNWRDVTLPIALAAVGVTYFVAVATLVIGFVWLASHLQWAP